MEKSLQDCSCYRNGGKHIDNYPFLQTLLPSEYDYIVCAYKNDEFIKSRFHINCFTKEQAREWLEKCSLNTNFTFDTEESSTLSTQVIHSKCQCSVVEPCQTMLEIILQSDDIQIESENENVLEQHPTTVILHYTHNPASDNVSEVSEFMIELIDEVDTKSEISADELPSYDFCADDDSIDHSPTISKSNDVTASSDLEQFVRKKLYYLFEKDYSPQQAYNLYKKELHETFTKEYQNSDDKSGRPCLSWVYKQYYAFFEEKHDVKIGPENTKGKNKKSLMTAQVEKTMQKMGITPNFHNNHVEFRNFEFKNQDPLGEKIEELCKNDSSKAAHLSSSYIIKFNSEKKTDKLNLFPLKLISSVSDTNDEKLQNIKLPEMRIVQNYKNNERVLEVMGAGRTESQNIPIPSGVDGVIILTNDQEVLKQGFTSIQNIETWNDETLPDTKKNKRKSVIKCENPDEIIFTDNVEDLKDIVQPQKKYKRKLYDDQYFSSKKLRVILPRALDGIENVICSD